MHLTSIYSPINILDRGSAVQWFKENWWIASIIIALHFLAMYIWILKPDIEQSERLDEVVIDLSIAQIVPKTAFEQRKQEYLEKKELPDAAKPARGLITTPSPVSPVLPVSPASSPVSQGQPSEVAQAVESTASVKLNEVPIKPIKVDKVEKAEPLADKKIPLPPTEKVEEKKPQLAPQPIADAAIPNMLPAIVDKKNKDKEAPEVAPSVASASATGAPAAAVAAAAPVDSSKGGSGSAGVASAAPAPTSAQSGRSGLAMPTPSTTEMQGQIASPKSSTLAPLGGNAGTADADYKSDGLKNAQPNYPLYARKMNQEGVVILSVEVLTDGSAGDVRVATSSGIRLLDKAALEAVKEWNFKPAKKDGVLYVQRLRVPIVFSLSSK